MVLGNVGAAARSGQRVKIYLASATAPSASTTTTSAAPMPIPHVIEPFIIPFCIMPNIARSPGVWARIIVSVGARDTDPDQGSAGNPARRLGRCGRDRDRVFIGDPRGSAEDAAERHAVELDAAGH